MWSDVLLYKLGLINVWKTLKNEDELFKFETTNDNIPFYDIFLTKRNLMKQTLHF